MENENNVPKPEGYSKDDGFTSEGKKTIKTLESITKATTKANKELESYAETYKELNKQLQTLQKSGGIPSVSSKVIKFPTSSTGGSKSPSKSSAKEKQLNDLFKSISGGKGKTAIEALTKLSPKAFTGLSTELTALTSVGAKAVPVIGAVVTVLSAMYVVGNKAYEQNMQLNRSLMSMGARSSELTKSTSDAANAAIKAKNSWDIAGNNLTQAFEPVYAGFQELLGWLGTAVADVTKGANDKSQYTQGNSMARWYTSQMEQNNQVPESVSLPVISQTATQFGASGMDAQSSANAAITTYAAAYKIALDYGVQSQQVAKDLSDAWLNGSDSAVKYGIVVNDNILAGYMASKGVDIVNVKITDATKQAYQYQLIMDEAAAGDSNAMRAQIAQWNILGQKIADASQQLFSYDKVINLQGRDYSTPTIALGSVDTGGPSGTPSGGAGITPPVNPSGGTPTQQVNVQPVVDTQPIKALEAELAKIPNPYNVAVPVAVPGFETIPALERELGRIPQNNPVSIPVSIPGFEAIPALERELGRVPQTYPVNIPVTMPGYEFIPNALQNIFQLPQNYPVNIPISVPGLDLLREAVNLQHQLANSPAWSTSAVSSYMPSASFAPMGVQRSLATSPSSVLSGSRVGSNVSSPAFAPMGVQRGLAPSTQNVLSVNSASSQTPHYSATPANLAAFANTLGVSQGQLNTAASFGGINGFDVMYKAYQLGDMGTVNKYLGYAGTATTASQFAAPTALVLTGAVATGTVAVPAVTGLAAKASDFISNASNSVPQTTKGWVTDAARGGASSANNMGWLENLIAGFAVPQATGGIGVKETLVHAFEGNKAEAIIPLETAHGQNMLSSALGLALKSNQGGGATREMTVNVNIGGMLLTDNPSAVRKLGGIIREEIARQDNKDGGLNYGTGK